MGSKFVLLIGLSMAVFLMISYEATATRELTKTNTVSLDTTGGEKANEVGEDKHQGDGYGGGYPGGRYGGGGGYPGGGGGYPGGGGGYPGGGGGYPGGGGRYPGGGGGRCYYGCCYKGYYGRCRRCCSYKGEAVVSGEP